MMQFGLIGYPLGHSYSKGHFSNKFEREGLVDCRYDNFEISSADQLKEIIFRHPDLRGLNVTIPHKQAVIPFIDEIDPTALQIGAVNTIKIFRSDNVCLKGYNTDVIGFQKSLERWPLRSSINALVFGTGGSSLAVKHALNRLNIKYISVSRNFSHDQFPYESITREIAANHLLWINCTPVGMFPDITSLLPLPYDCLTSSHYLFDLIYNPDMTRFLSMGVRAGAKVMNGSIMLYEQAEASWRIWTEEQE
jgi:shikimate dehydrogenase